MKTWLIFTLFLLMIPMVAAAGLEIESFSIDNRLLNDGDTATGIEPGQTVDVEIVFKNTNARNSKIDIDDIRATLLVQGINNGQDIEVSSDEFGLDPQDRRRVRLEFVVPLKVQHGKNYRVTMRADGFDTEGRLEQAKNRAEIEIEKPLHGIGLLDIFASPERLQCDNSVIVDAHVINLGSNNEQHAVVRVVSDQLNLSYQTEFTLQESPVDDDFDKIVTVVFDLPQRVAAGDYPLRVETYYERTFFSQSKDVGITVIECPVNLVEPDIVQYESVPLENKIDPSQKQVIYMVMLSIVLGLTVAGLTAALIYNIVQERKNNTVVQEKKSKK